MIILVGSKICPKCKLEKDISEFYSSKEYYRNTVSYCKPCHVRTSLEQVQRLRNKCFEILGQYCRQCGFLDKRALQIDHINGGGTKERRGVGSNKFYNEVLRNPAKFQILCANCNMIKRITNNEMKRKVN